MKILVACEFSNIVSQAFRLKGHSVTSCDIIPSDNLSPGQHIIADVLSLDHSQYDLMICFPPCTYLAKCQLHLNSLERQLKRQQAYWFCLRLFKSKCKRVALENPIGYLNTHWCPPEQITSPHYFGSPYKKDVCLWLKNVPPLMHTYMSPGTKRVANHVNGRMSQAEKSKIKSKFFPEMAAAMANQWTEQYLFK